MFIPWLAGHSGSCFARAQGVYIVILEGLLYRIESTSRNMDGLPCMLQPCKFERQFVCLSSGLSRLARACWLRQNRLMKAIDPHGSCRNKHTKHMVALHADYHDACIALEPCFTREGQHASVPGLFLLD